MLSSKAAEGRIRGKSGSLVFASSLIMLALCLCFSCSRGSPGKSSSGRVDSGLSFAAGELDTKLSEGGVSYYKAVLTGGAASASGAGTSGTTVTSTTAAQGEEGGKGESSSAQESGQALAIVDSGPRDELPSIVKRPQIYVVFSKPVVPLSALGAVMTSTPLMKIEPRAKGVYRWYGSRMLAFEAAEDLLPQRLYTVSLAKDLKALDGTRLSGDASFSFHSEYLAMREIIPGDISNARSEYGDSYVDESALTDIPPGKSGDFLVRFNYPVDPALVAKSLELSSGGAQLAYAASRPPAAKEGFSYRDGIDRYLRIQTRAIPPENADITIVLRSGARSEREALGSAEDQILSFHTLLPFGFTEYSEYSWQFDEDEVPDRNPLFLTFSHPVKPESLAGAFSFAEGPAIPPSAISSHEGTVRINGLSLARGSAFKLVISPGITDIYGRKLGSPVEVTIQTAPDSAYVEFPDSGSRMLEAGQPPKIAFVMKNMVSGGVGLASVADPYRKGTPVSLLPWDMTGVKPGVPSFGLLDLSPRLGAKGTGTVGIDWSFRPAGQKARDSKGSLTVQVTDLGLTLRYAYNRVICLVTKLSTGLPVPGALVTLMADRSPAKVGTSDARGLAVFSLAPGEYRSDFIKTKKTGEETDAEWESGWRNGRRDSLRIKVESGQDRVEFLPNESHDVYSGPVQATEPIATVETPRQVAFLFSDRKIYRPGEEVGFRGIDRDLKLGRYSSYRGNWTVHLMPPEWDAKPILTLRGACSELGGFFGTFVLPAGSEPGEYSIVYERGQGSFSESGELDEAFYGRPQVREWIMVASYRKQLFSVSIGLPAKTLLAGDSIAAEFSASYLSGGTLAQAAWNGYWTREPAWFDFGPAWSQYSFNPGEEGNRSTLDEKAGTLSEKGTASSSMPTTAKDAAGRPWTYTFNLNVTDATSGKLVGASRSFFVHPASFALGLKLKGSAGPWLAVAEKGKPAAFEAVMVDPEGKEYAGSSGRKSAVEISRVEWKVARQQGADSRINTRYERVETPVATMQVELPRPASSPDQARPAAFSFTPDSAGEYSVKISATDSAGRKAITFLSLYVTGSGYTRWNPESSEAIDLKPDKELYLPGETAKILVRSPLPAGRYLLTIEREGIFEERIVELTGSSSMLEIPLKEEYLPIVYVTLSSYTVRTHPASTKWGEPDLDKPKGLFGLAALVVDSPSRRIFLSVKPDRDFYLPGSRATVTIKATDSAGKPVRGAEISFMAADRGVLDLVDYHVPDPRETFYSSWNFPLATMGADSRSLLLDPVTYELKDLQGGAGDDGKEGAERSDFRSTAVFLPFLLTDSGGVAVASFPWPDSLTTWRCTAVAADTERFGLAESEIQVRNPVNAKSLMPELLRLRDTVSAGLMITNLESSERLVAVTCSSQLLAVAEGGKDKSVLVKPGQSARLDFRMSATKEGEGKVQFALRTEGFSETLVQSIRVEAPKTYESVSIIGSTRDRVEEGLILPMQDFGSGSLDISLSPSLLPALGGAFDFLFTYPYGCLEQRISALEPLVLFGEKAQDHGISSRVGDPRAVVAEGLDFIARRQLSGGGFPYWPEGDSPNRYVSIRLAWLLREAAEKGYPIPESMDIGALLGWIASSGGGARPKQGQAAETEGRDYLSVCADYVLALYGYDIRSRLEPVLKAKASGGVAPYALAGLALEASGDRAGAERVFASIRNLLVPSLRGVDLTDPAPGASSWYGGSGATSGVESLSFVLMLSNALEPGGELTGKIARTLLDRQSSGYWRSTSETVMALRALSRVIDGEDRLASPGTASASSGKPGGSVSAGGKLLHETDFSGSPVSSLRLPLGKAPLDSLPRGMPLPYEFKSAGGYPLYFSSSLRYAIPEELALARDEGIGLFTEILSMDGKEADSGKLAIGSLYRMRVVVSSARDRSFVAIRVPVASGCEIVDSRFLTAARVAQRPEGGTEESADPELWRPSAIQSIYDNEVRYFFDFFDKGQRSMEFVFRAGSSGTYPLPPATAECMYEPEIFGRGAGGITIIGEAPRR